MSPAGSSEDCGASDANPLLVWLVPLAQTLAREAVSQAEETPIAEAASQAEAAAAALDSPNCPALAQRRWHEPEPALDAPNCPALAQER